MIRVATIEDLDILSRMALEFIRKTAYALFYDEGRVVEVVKHFLLETGSDRVILIDEEGRGFLAGVRTPFMFGTDYVATEIAWWVDEEHRKSGIGLELLNGFEYWASKVGCKFVTMVSLDDRVEEVYKKQGYKLYERAYMKVINYSDDFVAQHKPEVC